MTSCQSIRRCRSCRRSCRVCRTKKQCPKNVGRCAREHGHLRIVTEKTRRENEDNGLEVRGLQAGDGRRGSNASQSIWCCFDAAVFQQFLAMRTEQAVQQISAMYREFSKSFETQHQTAPVTPVHVSQIKIEDEGGKENEEEQRMSASGVTQVKVMEMSSTHPEKEMEVVSDRLAGSNMEMNAKTHRRDPVSPLSQQQQQPPQGEMVR